MIAHQAILKALKLKRKDYPVAYGRAAALDKAYANDGYPPVLDNAFCAKTNKPLKWENNKS